MTVAAILNGKGRDVFTEPSTRSLSEICASLGGRRVGAIVLCDEPGVIVGIVSERDVVRAIAMEGTDALSHPVSEYMTKEVTVCTEADSVTGLMALMTEGRFRHMPVVEDGKLIGLVSIGDIVKFRIAQVEREAHDLRNYIQAV
ncbi:inosine 5'-monophosphate dehydrogenase [Pseudovibrio axinellae]|uniref:Inosine 5'-monophosphate dehydrogenase n=1 Tax=Pseudovibrio axinellae TaxID=989403 RepID=A0A166AKT3_9HYPH|nr:CBS domain-containing protein [Pseudovibrio axinellae]KZL21247.1 inosine 5'-monophosphate dehydrogenase [Pseudovibrio axinellae]SEQ93396.1 CBS domain-containing protein [Pseudovibrio axinellae]